jgi:hypothetical protein
VKNIIVVGDSFCAGQEAWPTMLAKHLGLNLIGQGFAGASWWPSRNFLMSLSQKTINDTEVIVFAHTNSGRIPTLNQNLVAFDHGSKPQNEMENAVHLYYKYIFEDQFLDWAQQQWFKEIDQLWGHKKICHLHCFPWTNAHQHLLSGLTVQPNLSAISLNEISATDLNLFSDTRANHLNLHNNCMLAQELAQMISSNLNGIQNLNLDLFDQPTRSWLEWR